MPRNATEHFDASVRCPRLVIGLAAIFNPNGGRYDSTPATQLAMPTPATGRV